MGKFKFSFLQKKKNEKKPLPRRVKTKKHRRNNGDRGRVPDHRPSPSTGLCLAITTVLLVFSLAVLIRGPFEIREVQILGETRYSPSEIEEAIGDLRERNYLSIDREEISSKAVGELKYLDRLEFDFSFPFSLTITAYPRTVSYYSVIETEIQVIDESIQNEEKRVIETLPAGIYIFDKSLRLVEVLPADSPTEAYLGYTKLSLPEGMLINKKLFPIFDFSIKADDMARLADDISAVRAQSAITSADFSNPYNIKLILDKKYLICFGSLEAREEKLVMVRDIFAECESHMFEDRTLRIDVSIIASPTYTFDVSFNK